MSDVDVEKVDVIDYLNIKRATPVANQGGSTKDRYLNNRLFEAS